MALEAIQETQSLQGAQPHSENKKQRRRKPRRRCAFERRQQRLRAEWRTVQRLLRAADAMRHRGCAPTASGTAFAVDITQNMQRLMSWIPSRPPGQWQPPSVTRQACAFRQADAPQDDLRPADTLPQKSLRPLDLFAHAPQPCGLGQLPARDEARVPSAEPIQAGVLPEGQTCVHHAEPLLLPKPTTCLLGDLRCSLRSSKPSSNPKPQASEQLKESEHFTSLLLVLRLQQPLKPTQAIGQPSAFPSQCVGADAASASSSSATSFRSRVDPDRKFRNRDGTCRRCNGTKMYKHHAYNHIFPCDCDQSLDTFKKHCHDSGYTCPRCGGTHPGCACRGPCHRCGGTGQYPNDAPWQNSLPCDHPIPCDCNAYIEECKSISMRRRADQCYKR